MKVAEELRKFYSGEFWKRYTLEEHLRLNYSRIEYVLFILLCTASTVLSAIMQPPQGFIGLNIGVWLPDLKFVWLFYLPMALVIAFAILSKRARDELYLERRVQSKPYKVIFQITTRGYEVDAVTRGVRSVLYWAPKYLRDFEVWIVTEETIPRENREKLLSLARESDRVRVVFVPRDYSTPRGTAFKARALCYALELRKRMGYVRSDVWVYLMDEESVVGEDTVISIIDFIENEGSRGKMAAQGTIVYPNFWGLNFFTSMFDSVRPMQDLTLLRVQYRYGRPLFGVHGSHMLLRADMEAAIGWDFGVVMAEDLVFGLVSARKVGRVWGWLRGKLYEQSPFSLRDFLKQRRRWVWGLIDALRHRDIALRDKILVGLNYLLWLGGLPSAVVTIVNAILPTPLPTLAMIPFLGFLMATWLYLYWEGCKLNIEMLPVNKLVRRLLRLLALALAPLAGIIESVAVWYGVLTYPRARRVGYELVKK